MTSKASTLATLVAALLLAITAPLGAQSTINCPEGFTATPDGACQGELTVGRTVDARELRVPVTAAPGTVVRFRVASGGGVVLPDSVLLGSGGTATTYWSRRHADTSAVVLVEAVTKEGNTLRALNLVAPELPDTAQARLRIHSGNGQDWFEKRPLPFPLVTEITRGPDSLAITRAEDCSAYRVVYRRAGSAETTILTDTVRPRILDSGMGEDSVARNRDGCFAYGSASLGEQAGVRYIDASLVGPKVSRTNDHRLFTTYARALPRLVAALGATYTGRIHVLEADDERKGKVIRPLPDSGRIEVDTTVSRNAVRDVGGMQPATVVGVTTPIPVASLYQRVNVMAGVDLLRPTSSLFLGLSLPNLRWGARGEALPLGLYGLVNYQRREVLTDPELCETESKCTKATRGFGGVTILVTYDAGDAIASLVKNLGL